MEKWNVQDEAQGQEGNADTDQHADDAQPVDEGQQVVDEQATPDATPDVVDETQVVDDDTQTVVDEPAYTYEPGNESAALTTDGALFNGAVAGLEPGKLYLMEVTDANDNLMRHNTFTADGEGGYTWDFGTHFDPAGSVGPFTINVYPTDGPNVDRDTVVVTATT